MGIFWRPRTAWRHSMSSPAGYGTTGTWHAFDTDLTGPPLPHSGRPSIWPLCGRDPDELNEHWMKPDPPAGAPTCRKCWVAAGRDLAVLDAQRAELKASIEERRRNDAAFRRWKDKVMYVLPEDLLVFLERYEIYETDTFVREALDAIARERKEQQ